MKVKSKIRANGPCPTAPISFLSDCAVIASKSLGCFTRSNVRVPSGESYPQKKQSPRISRRLRFIWWHQESNSATTHCKKTYLLYVTFILSLNVSFLMGVSVGDIPDQNEQSPIIYRIRFRSLGLRGRIKRTLVFPRISLFRQCRYGTSTQKFELLTLAVYQLTC